MMKRFVLSLCLLAISLATQATPDEGMWLPLHIKRLNHVDMQKKGLQLTAEEIYSINNSSLKDAVVSLGGGFCTAEVVSKEGLLLTNHHCAFDAIQTHSTIENDYLTNGFWAKTKADEKSNKGLTASFLVRMEDVTKRVLENVTPEMTESQRNGMIGAAFQQIKQEAEEGTHYNATVKSFFNGNEFYLFVYETFRDVRLVGAPPSSIGKFGGDTDNWMWPRHTGDFAMFRIYAGKDGKPADYSPENVPLTPKHHLPISMSGVSEGDFAMIMGYPGRTDRYLTSYGVKLAIDQTNPSRVKLRDKKLSLMKEDMEADDKVRIMYASKYASISNYWKYFIGQTQGLKRLNVIGKKEAQEKEFKNWLEQDPARKAKYGEALQIIEQAFNEQSKYNLSQVYLSEAGFGPEIMAFAYDFKLLNEAIKSKSEKEEIKELTEELKKSAETHFKDYNPATDKKIFAAMMQAYYKDIAKEQHPDIFATVTSKYKGDFNNYAEDVYNKSIFASKEKTMAFLNDPNSKAIENDPAFKAINSLYGNYQKNIMPKAKEVAQQLEKGNRLYIAGLLEMHPDKKFYPSANSTMRITYGQVLDYVPRDAVKYDYYTTIDGIIEKEDPKADPKHDEFYVPVKLKDLYKAKDYGRYGENGQLKVAFITNTDITGGNSGSPVINGKGELIGIAFDGNWEAMSGDIAFEPDFQRTISVDIRYVLFIIDKFAGAGHLVDEMTLVNNKPTVKAENKVKEEPKVNTHRKTKSRKPAVH